MVGANFTPRKAWMLTLGSPLQGELSELDSLARGWDSGTALDTF
jgi:hypothetical protein